MAKTGARINDFLSVSYSTSARVLVVLEDSFKLENVSSVPSSFGKQKCQMGQELALNQTQSTGSYI